MARRRLKVVDRHVVQGSIEVLHRKVRLDRGCLAGRVVLDVIAQVQLGERALHVLHTANGPRFKGQRRAAPLFLLRTATDRSALTESVALLASLPEGEGMRPMLRSSDLTSSSLLFSRAGDPSGTSPAAGRVCASVRIGGRGGGTEASRRTWRRATGAQRRQRGQGPGLWQHARWTSRLGGGGGGRAHIRRRQGLQCPLLLLRRRRPLLPPLPRLCVNR